MAGFSTPGALCGSKAETPDFTRNRPQAVRLSANVRLPGRVKTAQGRARGMDRIISPVGRAWDAFCMNGPQACDDFVAERAAQWQTERGAF